MTMSDRPPDPVRFEAVERLIGKGLTDAEICKRIVKRFSCHRNTAANDIKLWEKLNREAQSEKREAMRVRLDAQLDGLASVQRRAGEVAIRRAADADDDMASAMLSRAAASMLKNAEVAIGRRAQLWGVNETDRIKLDLLRLKLLGAQSEEELEKAIAAEVAKAVETMPLAELEAIVARRQDVTTGEVQ